ncbi:amidohydrolase [Oceanobacillus polygoni]|uniref:Amidohydrolase n=1 Tax=Oceanobacillus polygoni TaxID=1235259 RepID=A0A9X0YQH7_9BACI|nr:amidohydrolase [Oceanobacillus polygoni]MBP2077055.1 amidohydrolase [Oceanobacillus polygoni]
MDLNKLIEEVIPDVIAWRRAMHEHPELSFEEYWTSQYIEDQLRQMDHIEFSRPTKTSVLGIIKGKKPGKKIGLRADIDALPIQEERDDLEFKSKKAGVMHACGHDGHAAILLGAARVLSQNIDLVSGEIYLIFQHAEEQPPGGAQEMVATGLFNDLDFVYGQHLFTPISVGKIGITKGPITSNSDTYDLLIKGKGGHASQPEDAIDPIVIGTQIINQFQTIVSRITSPLDSVVISTTQFHAGSATNVIPDTATLQGSIRTIHQETRELVKEKMEKAVASVCDFYGADFEFNFQFGYDAVLNNEEKTDRVIDIATQLFGERVFHYPLVMGGEDFGAFSKVIPGTFVFIGARNEEKSFDYPHHHPKFAIDEASFIDGVKLMVHVGLEMGK